MHGYLQVLDMGPVGMLLQEAGIARATRTLGGLDVRRCGWPSRRVLPIDAQVFAVGRVCCTRLWCDGMAWWNVLHSEARRFLSTSCLRRTSSIDMSIDEEQHRCGLSPRVCITLGRAVNLQRPSAVYRRCSSSSHTHANSCPAEASELSRGTSTAKVHSASIAV